MRRSRKGSRYRKEKRTRSDPGILSGYTNFPCWSSYLWLPLSMPVLAVIAANQAWNIQYQEWSACDLRFEQTECVHGFDSGTGLGNPVASRAQNWTKQLWVTFWWQLRMHCGGSVFLNSPLPRPFQTQPFNSMLGRVIACTSSTTPGCELVPMSL